MAKQVMNSINPDSPAVPEDNSKELAKIANKAIFSPSTNQVKIKAKFWHKFTPGPFSSPESITMAMVLETTKATSIRKWWAEPGFVDWFMNREEEREKIKYLFNLGLDSAEQLLLNPDANPNAKVNIIKLLAELNGHIGKKAEERYIDADVARMDETQLKEYLKRSGVKLVEEKVVETSANKNVTKE